MALPRIVCIFLLGIAAAVHGQTESGGRAPSHAEQELDAAAFKGMDQAIAEQSADVQSVVVVLRGRPVYAFYRDGNPAALRDVQSLAKSALSTLTGIALAQGRIPNLDQPVVALMPAWASLNNDPRASAITVRHLLTMTAGFEVNDPSGTAAPGRPQDAWARPLRSAPGQAFAYDNALVPMLSAVLEKVSGMPLAAYAREQIVGTMGMAEPSYQGGGLQMRTSDMAKLGQLFLQNGVWDGRRMLAESYVRDATRAQSPGGPPVSMPYGYMWWVVPSNAPRPTFMASGYGGQFIWVHPPLDLVVAITSTVSAGSQARGQALGLIRGRLFAAAQQRAAGERR